MTTDVFFEWFCVAHEAVFRDDTGLHFADKSEPGDGRRVIVAAQNGPNAILYPRSRQTWGHGHPHDAHRPGTCGPPEDCHIDSSGQVLMLTPVRVDAEHLSDENYSCFEPSGPLRDALASRRAL